MKSPYWNMSLGKFLTIALFIGGVVSLFWVVPYRLEHGFGIFTAKHPTSIHQEVELMTPDHQGHSDHAALDVTPKPVPTLEASKKLVHLPNQHLTANVGQYGTEEAAKKELANLKQHLNDCVTWYKLDLCNGLADKAAVQRSEWPGGVTYVLVIERLDEPTLHALCNFMWNGDDRQWARETYHRCTELNHEDDL